MDPASLPPTDASLAVSALFLDPQFLLGVLRSIDDFEDDLLEATPPEEGELHGTLHLNLEREFLGFRLLGLLSTTSKAIYNSTVLPVARQLRHAVVRPNNRQWFNEILSGGDALEYVRLDRTPGDVTFGRRARTIIACSWRDYTVLQNFPRMHTFIAMGVWRKRYDLNEETDALIGLSMPSLRVVVFYESKISAALTASLELRQIWSLCICPHYVKGVYGIYHPKEDESGETEYVDIGDFAHVSGCISDTDDEELRERMMVEYGRFYCAYANVLAAVYEYSIGARPHVDWARVTGPLMDIVTTTTALPQEIDAIEYRIAHWTSTQPWVSIVAKCCTVSLRRTIEWTASHSGIKHLLTAARALHPHSRNRELFECAIAQACCSEIVEVVQ